MRVQSGGVDLLRVVLLTVIAVFLTGCVTGSGADYASLSQKIGAPKGGQARIVVFREQAFRGSRRQSTDVDTGDADARREPGGRTGERDPEDDPAQHDESDDDRRPAQEDEPRRTRPSLSAPSDHGRRASARQGREV